MNYYKIIHYFSYFWDMSEYEILIFIKNNPVSSIKIKTFYLITFFIQIKTLGYLLDLLYYDNCLVKSY